MKTLILTLFFGIAMVKSQIVNIPDVAFKQKLLDANSANHIAMNLNGEYVKIDTNNDLQIQVSEAMQIKEISLGWTFAPSIKSLVGIESFKNLTYLGFDAEVANLDISNNVLLETLWCYSNNLSTLDVSKNINLKELICDYNYLTSLNLKNNPLLTTLSFGNNPISSIELSSNLSLKNLWLQNTNISSLNVTKNKLLKSLDCSNNPNLYSLNLRNGNNQILGISSQDPANMTANPKLKCIIVDNPNVNYNYWYKDNIAVYRPNIGSCPLVIIGE